MKLYRISYEGEFMSAIIRPHCFSGTVQIPASKSHTVRRLLIAALAEGISEIEHPLDSLDTRSCVSVCRALGAEITEHRGCDAASPNPKDERGEKLLRWTVRGIEQGNPHSQNHNVPVAMESKYCNVGNSGTTFFLGLAAAALGTTPVEFDGDAQLRRRSAGPLLEALAGLGVSVSFASGGGAANGCAPVTVRGPWKGGSVSLSCPTSQYLSALLLAAPLALPGAVTEIKVPLLNERPYIEMTLSYLDSQGIPYEAAEDFSCFSIPGGSTWKSVSGPVPGDFSSAAFPAAAAVISGGSVTLLGLERDDTQGDKAFFGFLEKMGCSLRWKQVPGKRIPLGQNISAELEAIGVQSAELFFEEWQLTVTRSGPLQGGEFDLNDTPDLLPALAAVACFARGDTALVNVAHARIKETDRIAVMARELGKLGVKTTERPDGLIIHGAGGISKNAGTQTGAVGKFMTDGSGDHRVVMALAAAALGCPAPVEISGAESADVSYPGFLELLVSKGGK